MRLVDDVHLVALVSGGRVHRAFAKVACVVDAAVGGRIDLHDVETRCSAPYTFARHAHATRLAVFTAVLAVERHREHASERRFADAARSAQQVAMRNSAARNRALQRRRHVRLHGDVAEALRAVFASEGDHGMERRAWRVAAWRAAGIYFTRRTLTKTTRAGMPLEERSSPRECPRPTEATGDTSCRCYLRGPDGVRRLSPSGTWDVCNIVRIRSTGSSMIHPPSASA